MGLYVSAIAVYLITKRDSECYSATDKFMACWKTIDYGKTLAVSWHGGHTCAAFACGTIYRFAFGTGKVM